MVKSILLFPYGGNAREALSIINDINRRELTWKVEGFLDDNEALIGESFGGVRVIGSTSLLKQYTDSMVLAVPGRPETYKHRLNTISKLGIPHSRFASIVHPSVFIGEGTSIGVNCLIMPNCVLTSGVRVGNHVLILPNAVVSHDTSIGEGTMIGSNVSLSGTVKIEGSCYIGTGTRVIQEVTIGAGALVGLGAVVIRDVKSNTVVAGCPAKEIRSSSF